MEDKKYKIISNDIAQFLSCVNSHIFTSDIIDRQYNIQTREAKQYRWRILEALVEKREIEKLGTGKYRKVDSVLEEINWQSANVEDTVNLALPLGLQKFVKIYHRSVIIVAGAPGAGKSAFLYNLTLRNMHARRGVVLFTNDMTPEEIKERMINAEIEIPTPPPFKVYDRADNFGDVIFPNAINVIDYLDLNSEFYLIGEEIEKIYRKLDRGIAVIAIQKNPQQEIGLGGVGSLKRAKLYLTLDSIKEDGDLFHKLAIKKARGRVDPKVNPCTLDIKFNLVGGIKFIKRGL